MNTKFKLNQSCSKSSLNEGLKKVLGDVGCKFVVLVEWCGQNDRNTCQYNAI